MAKQLSIPVAQARVPLLTAIRKKQADTQRLQEILNARELNNSDDDSENDTSNLVGTYQNEQSASVTINNEDEEDENNGEE